MSRINGKTFPKILTQPRTLGRVCGIRHKKPGARPGGEGGVTAYEKALLWAAISIALSLFTLCRVATTCGYPA